jgi:hypothetical protein
MTLCHRRASSSTKAEASFGELPTTVNDIVRKRSATAGLVSTEATSVAILATMGPGVSPGAATPYHVSAISPGSAREIGSTPGSAPIGPALVTPRALARPSVSIRYRRRSDASALPGSVLSLAYSPSSRFQQR